MAQEKNSAERTEKEEQLLNTLKEHGGRMGVLIGNAFLKLDKDEQAFALVAMGCKAYLEMDEICIKALIIALTKIKEQMPTEADILIRLFNFTFAGLAKKYEAEMRAKNKK